MTFCGTLEFIININKSYIITSLNKFFFNSPNLAFLDNSSYISEIEPINGMIILLKF